MDETANPNPISSENSAECSSKLPLHFGPSQACIREPAEPALIIKMLDEWMADESGYDEAVWPELKANLERNRQGSRRLFRD